MALIRGKPNTDNRRVLTPGESLRVRRGRLGWTIRVAAERAGLNPETVINIEKDRGVLSRKLDAYKAAIDAAEKEQPQDATSPVIAPSTTTEDVAALIKEYRQRLKRYEAFLVPILEDVRSGLAALDARSLSESERKRG
jgi:DNA-binding XRE family transcriptional regulator